tara:strand:- start:4811 stop:5008 length:198 start_codon:yes stop_codon:yes gene_type:complete
MLNPSWNDDRFRVVPVIEKHLAVLVTSNELFSGDPGTPILLTAELLNALKSIMPRLASVGNPPSR